MLLCAQRSKDTRGPAGYGLANFCHHDAILRAAEVDMSLSRMVADAFTGATMPGGQRRVDLGEHDLGALAPRHVKHAVAALDQADVVAVQQAFVLWSVRRILQGNGNLLRAAELERTSSERSQSVAGLNQFTRVGRQGCESGAPQRVRHRSQRESASPKQLSF